MHRQSFFIRRTGTVGTNTLWSNYCLRASKGTPGVTEILGGNKNKDVRGEKIYLCVLRENKRNNNSISAGAPPQARWESSQRSSRPPTGFEGVLLLREGNGRDGKGREGKGEVE